MGNAGLVISLVSLIVYWNTLYNGFVWDDRTLIIENKIVTDTGFKNLWDLFVNNEAYPSAQPGDVYRPLYILSYILDYSLYGLNPWGYHLTNIIFHSLNSVLVFLVVRMFINQSQIPNPKSEILNPPFLTALLFATHPIHTESVAYVKGRDDLLLFFFFFLSLYFYIKNFTFTVYRSCLPLPRRQAGNRQALFTVHYLSALLFYAIALLSKETAIILPLVLFLYDYSLNKGSVHGLRFTIHSIMKRYLPFVTIAVVYLLARTLVSGQVGQGAVYWAGGFIPTMYTMAKGIAYYIKLLIFPINLCGDYLNFPVSKSIDGPVILSLSLILSLLVGAVIAYRYSKEITFGIFWFFITLLPVSNIIPLRVLIAERFLYLPSLGFCLILGVAINRLWRVTNNRLQIAGLFFILLIVLYSLGTISRNKVWMDEYTFWSDVVRKYPANPQGLNNLALQMDKRGEYDEAISLFERALVVDPGDDSLHASLAITYRKRGLLDQAITEYKMALKLNPNSIEVHNDLGAIYGMKGMYNEAIEEFKEALRLDPGDIKTHYNLGFAYMNIRDCEAAAIEFTFVLKSVPQNESARRLLEECQKKIE